MIINNAFNTECDDSRMGASLKQLIKISKKILFPYYSGFKEIFIRKKDFDSYLRPSETHKKLWFSKGPP